STPVLDAQVEDGDETGQQVQEHHIVHVVFLCRQLGPVVPHASAKEKLLPSDTCGQGPVTNRAFVEEVGIVNQFPALDEWNSGVSALVLWKRPACLLQMYKKHKQKASKDRSKDRRARKAARTPRHA
ncbi:unnamed protein product, partial [Ectocarpus sp. 12 AP-2014]